MFTEPQAVPAVDKSPKKSEGHSVFSWLIVLALLGAWISVAVVWFDFVEYSSVVGRATISSLVTLSSLVKSILCVWVVVDSVVDRF